MALCAASAALSTLGSPRSAAAYAYESAVGPGCHERITMGALRTLRTQLSTAPALAPEGDDLALIDDLPFSIDPDMKDVAATTLLVGVRDNDLKGRGPADISQLAAIHGNPENQREHCLRAIDDNEPDGSERALVACRAFIRDKFVDALEGLDAAGVPDPARRIDIDVSLSLRGTVTASLPRFWVRIGQAMHTLQDGFAHTFRSPDRMRVRTVLNWIEYVNGGETESRDGPVHRNGLDQCDKLDDLRERNMGVASQASVDLLRAGLDPSLSHDQKLAAVDAMLTKYLSFEAGCTEANGWCDAPEREYQVAAGCGCAVIGTPSRGALAAAACALGVLFLAVRRRRAGRRPGAARSALLPIALACVAFPAAARADATAPAHSTTAPPPKAPPPTVTPATVTPKTVTPATATPATAAATVTPATATPATAAPETITDPQTGATVATDEKKPPPGVPTINEAKSERIEAAHRSLFGVYAAVSGSVTNPGFSGQVGGRLRLSERWTVGLDGELNGWYAVHTGRFRTGAFNAYLTGIFRYPLRFETVNLRTTANLGTSTMLIDLYGAPRGTTGIFLGAVPLGLEWKLSSAVYVIFDALGIALPVPQLKGAPFAYPQYRTALGIELAF